MIPRPNSEAPIGMIKKASTTIQNLENKSFLSFPILTGVSEGKHHLLMKVANGVMGSGYFFQATQRGIPDDVRRILKKPIAERSDAQQQRFFTFYGMQSPDYRQQAARIEQLRTQPSRMVRVELVVNGQRVAEQVIEADGSLRDVTLEAKIERSSWVTMRILPSSHTNPVFVLVDGKPIRATAPYVADWDGDGKDDLLATQSGVIWYRNIGGPGNPALQSPVTLVPKSTMPNGWMRRHDEPPKLPAGPGHFIKKPHSLGFQFLQGFIDIFHLISHVLDTFTPF